MMALLIKLAANKLLVRRTEIASNDLRPAIGKRKCWISACLLGLLDSRSACLDWLGESRKAVSLIGRRLVL